ncbi:heat shock factor binding protein 1-domain-containing protein [Xylaria grammica]|nr:heat shock factor binding protein 1-domain-containing protein [Xylaria grammica]
MSSKRQEEHTADNTGNSSDELTTVVEELLNSLSNKFTTVSSEIFTKMDEMSRRLDNLEAALRANEEKTPGSPSKA